MALIDINRTQTIPIPDEPSQFVVLRPLTVSQLDEASEELVLQTLTKYGKQWDSLQALQTTKREEPQEEVIRKEKWDWQVLFKYAVVSWSYDQDPTPASFQLLDKVTRDWLWDTIVSMNVRPLVK